MKKELYDKFLKFNFDESSTNCKSKAHLINKVCSKFSRKHKDNSYVIHKDKIINGLRLLVNNLNYIDNVKTTETGRKDLKDMEKEIVDMFKEYETE